MSAIKIGLVGFGTVGSGVYEILKNNPLIQFEQVIVRDIDKARKAGLESAINLSTDIETLFNNPDIDLIIELMGGDTLPYSIIKRALENKKHVVTANKVVISKYGQELFDLAKDKGVNLLFEAAVAGGIPVILPLEMSLAANEIQSLVGILNGTCNFILTRMEKDAMSFEDALKKAQDLGFAEADPAADIEGKDPACKISILAGLAHGKAISTDDLYIEGISKITATDIQMATELGYKIRLVGMVNKLSNGLDIRVHPVLLPTYHPLANIYEENNAIWIKGSAVGELMFYGKGAGKMPTASAVCADALLIANSFHKENPVIESLRFQLEGKAQLVNIKDTENAYYICLDTTDQTGVVGNIGLACGEHGVSLKALIQKPLTAEQEANQTATIVLLTHPVAEGKLQKALEKIKQQSTTQAVRSVIRVFEQH